MVREANSGKYRRTRLFVLTLGYSRKAIRLLTFRSSTRIWAELHEKAFRRLGGVPRILARLAGTGFQAVSGVRLLTVTCDDNHISSLESM